MITQRLRNLSFGFGMAFATQEWQFLFGRQCLPLVWHTVTLSLESLAWALGCSSFMRHQAITNHPDVNISHRQEATRSPERIPTNLTGVKHDAADLFAKSTFTSRPLHFTSTSLSPYGPTFTSSRKIKTTQKTSVLDFSSPSSEYQFYLHFRPASTSFQSFANAVLLASGTK